MTRPGYHLWPTEEQALILAAAFGPDDAAIKAFAQWDEGADYEGDIDNGVFRLMPLVYRRMQALGVAQPIMPRLKGVYRRAWYDSQILFHLVAPAIALVRANNIDVVLLNGAPLLDVFYKGSGLRPTTDIDVVVGHGDLCRAIALLETSGWAPATPGATEFRDSHGHGINLHSHFLFDARNSSADTWFRAASVPYNFMGVQARRLDTTASLLHVVVQGLRPNAEPPVHWIADALAIFSEAADEIRWPNIVAFARTQRLTRRLCLGLSYMADQYGAPVPPDILRQLRASSLSFIEWAEQRYLFDLERSPSVQGRIFLALAGSARRSRDGGAPEFAGRVLSRIARRLGRRGSLDCGTYARFVSTAAAGRQNGQ